MNLWSSGGICHHFVHRCQSLLTFLISVCFSQTTGWIRAKLCRNITWVFLYMLYDFCFSFRNSTWLLGQLCFLIDRIFFFNFLENQLCYLVGMLLIWCLPLDRVLMSPSKSWTCKSIEKSKLGTKRCGSKWTCKKCGKNLNFQEQLVLVVSFYSL